MVTKRPPPPRVRAMATPGIRCSDSAIFVSGNLPSSSADIASTMPDAFCLTDAESCSEARIPVTTTSSMTSSPSAWAKLVVGTITTRPQTSASPRTIVLEMVFETFCIVLPPLEPAVGETGCPASFSTLQQPSLAARRQNLTARHPLRIGQSATALPGGSGAD